MSPSENVVGTPLVVCTAHIHWDPSYCDVKLIQSMMLVHEIGYLLDDVSSFFSPQNFLVFLLFTCPQFRSGKYCFFTFLFYFFFRLLPNTGSNPSRSLS